MFFLYNEIPFTNNFFIMFFLNKMLEVPEKFIIYSKVDIRGRHPVFNREWFILNDLSHVGQFEQSMRKGDGDAYFLGYRPGCQPVRRCWLFLHHWQVPGPGSGPGPGLQPLRLLVSPVVRVTRCAMRNPLLGFAFFYPPK